MSAVDTTAARRAARASPPPAAQALPAPADGVAGLVVVLGFVVMAVFAPWIAPYPAGRTDFNALLAQPSSEHLLGTDELGRDELSRHDLGRARVDAGRRARDAARDGDRGADRARRRLLPRLGRHGHRAR